VKKIRDADHRHLWDAYTKKHTSGVKAQIVEAYYPLVQYLAERLVSTLPASVEVGDLVSMGTFGLIEAIDRFDPSRGIQFKTYCTSRIRGAILDNLRTNDWVPRLVRLRTNLVDKTLRRLYGSLGREPTVPEMADALGLTVAAYESLRKEAKETADGRLPSPEVEYQEVMEDRVFDIEYMRQGDEYQAEDSTIRFVKEGWRVEGDPKYLRTIHPAPKAEK